MASTAGEIGAPIPSLSVDQVLTTTRSVRKRLDFTRPVPVELIEECLRIAQQAPIGSNAIHPHLVIVTDPYQRAALGQIYARACQEYLPLPFSVKNVQISDPRHALQQPRVLGSAIHLAQHMGDAPMLIVPTISPRPDSGPNWLAANVWGSVSAVRVELHARGALARAGHVLDSASHHVRGGGRRRSSAFHSPRSHRRP